jgi:integrase
MAAVSPDDIERVRDALDDKIRAGVISSKRAWNVWGTTTKAFHDAQKSKDRSLRTRTDNPAEGLEGPDAGIPQKRQHLYPSEFLAFVSCEDVPLRWRRLVTIALYTGLRAGELRALLWSDVDLEHRRIDVSKAVSRKTGILGPTKSGHVRGVTIEATLAPLLEVMGKGREPGELVTWLPAFDEQATLMRAFMQRADIKRVALFDDQSKTTMPLRFHDLRASAITWWAVRGDEPIHVMQRAGHTSFATTQLYLGEAQSLKVGFGEPFPALPPGLLRPPAQQVREVPGGPGDLTRAVLEQLAALGHPIAPGELATMLGRPYGSLWRALRQLREEGRVLLEGKTNAARVSLAPLSTPTVRGKKRRA